MTGGTVRSWVRLVSLGWLAVVTTLAAWALAPLAVGWQPLVVTSGSMAPALRPGDVAVVRPGPAGLAVGAVAVLRRPDVPEGLVVHRVVRFSGESLTTRGDANPVPDSATATAADVEGVVRYVVPRAGWPAMLLRRPTSPGAVLPALGTVAALAELVAAPTAGRRRRLTTGRAGPPRSRVPGRRPFPG